MLWLSYGAVTRSQVGLEISTKQFEEYLKADFCDGRIVPPLA